MKLVSAIDLVLAACLCAACLPSRVAVAPLPYHAGAPLRVDPAVFEGADGCFILYDLRGMATVAVFGEKRCGERYAACSTFKVPLALMAFDAGILVDENTELPWDGVQRSVESWNRNHSARTWMSNSVVWYSQRLTPLLGKERIERYLENFEYGNRDFSAGLTSAWLTITKSDADPGKGSLKISAFEQLEFFQRLWSDALPVSAAALAKTKRILFLEKSPAGLELHGKTGSGYLNDLEGDFGWFVGYLANANAEYVLVSAITRQARSADARYPGMRAKEIAKEILQENALW